MRAATARDGSPAHRRGAGRRVEDAAIDAVEIPAGQRVSLAPKSTHVMLMGLQRPLVAGQTFVVTLRFAKAGEQR